MRSRRPSLITRNVETWSHGVQAETHQAVKFNQRPEECSLERSIWAPCGTIAQAEHDSFLTFCGQNRQSGNENDPLFNIDPWAGRSLRENGPATNAVAAASSSGGNCAWPRSRITINESGNRATATSAGCMRPTSLCHEGDGVSKDMKKAAGFFLEGHGVAKLGINNLLLTSRILKAGA